MLIPHLHMIQGRASNIYLLEHEAGLSVIDTGMPGSLKRILAIVQQIGRQPNDIKQILITHTDTDHVGGLKALVEVTGANVLASAGAVPYLRNRTSPPHGNPILALPMSLVDRIARKTMDVDHVVADGDVVEGGIHVIATPGHTTDHLCYFWEAGRVLFAGDLFMHMKKLALPPNILIHNRTATVESARKVLALRPAVICPGHGSIWMGDSQGLIF